MRIFALAVLTSLAAAVLPAHSVTGGAVAFAATASERTKTAPQSGKKVTFLELGSVGCIPCEQMVPVMDAVRQRHGNQVEVIFHDVRKEPAVARQWRVVLIPTQVFLDSEGKEVSRHQGFFALGDVLKVLRTMGVD